MNPLILLRNPDRVFAIVVIALAALMYVIAGELAPPVNPGEIAASTWPKFILLCIIGMSCLILVRAGNQGWSGTTFRGVSVGMLCAIYIVSIEPVGYFLVTPVFLFLLPVLVGFRRYLITLISSAIGTGLVYLVFVRTLSIPLPPGLLGD